MAFLGKDHRITGSLGDLVFRTVNGRTIVQRKPEKHQVKQTKRTQQASSDFGRASTLAKKIRVGIQPFTRGFGDSHSFCRLRTQLQLAARTDNPAPLGEKNLWDGTPALLDGFEYNLHSPYEETCRISIRDVVLDAQRLHFTLDGFHPKQAITWPGGAEKAKVCFWISVHRREDDLPVYKELLPLAITPNNVMLPETRFSSQTLPAGGMLYLWGGILYYEYNSVLDWVCMNHKQLQPFRVLRVLRL